MLMVGSQMASAAVSAPEAASKAPVTAATTDGSYKVAQNNRRARNRGNRGNRGGRRGGNRGRRTCGNRPGSWGSERLHLAQASPPLRVIAEHIGPAVVSNAGARAAMAGKPADGTIVLKTVVARST